MIVALRSGAIEVSAKDHSRIVRELRAGVGNPRAVPKAASLEAVCTHRKELRLADDLKQTGKPDDARINVDQEHELDYWSKRVRVSREKLKQAVERAGPMVKDVQRNLGN